LQCRRLPLKRLLGGLTTRIVEMTNPKGSLMTTRATLPTIVAAEQTGPGWMTLVITVATDASPVRGTAVHGGMRRPGVRTGKKRRRTRKRAT